MKVIEIPNDKILAITYERAKAENVARVALYASVKVNVKEQENPMKFLIGGSAIFYKEKTERALEENIHFLDKETAIENVRKSLTKDLAFGLKDGYIRRGEERFNLVSEDYELVEIDEHTIDQITSALADISTIIEIEKKWQE